MAGGFSALLIEGTKGYATYVDGVVEGMVQAVDHLKATIDSGDLAAAQKAYALARPFYERIEADVEGFVLPDFEATDNAGNLDYLIDMRQSDLDPAVGWHGLHAIGRDLFEKRSINAETKALAAELRKKRCSSQQAGGDVGIPARGPANGAASLLEEVQSGKITGEEEAYSHVDLVDFAAEYRRRSAGLRLSHTWHAEDRPRADEADPGPVRRGEPAP